MLNLRMTEGIREDAFLRRHRIPLMAYCGDTLLSLQQRGLLAHTDSRWHLTRRGMDVQNAILVEIMEAVEA